MLRRQRAIRIANRTFWLSWWPISPDLLQPWQSCTSSKPLNLPFSICHLHVVSWARGYDLFQQRWAKAFEIAVGAILLMGVLRGELPQLWKWSDDEGETEKGEQNKVTWAEAAQMDETPVVGDYARKANPVEGKPTTSTEDQASPSVTTSQDDEDWMNLENDKSENGKSKKKKASKKKK